MHLHSKMSTVSKSLDRLVPIIEGLERNVARKPLIIGISGPQGSGKSFLAENLQIQLKSIFPDLNVVQFSMDDFYLPYKEQKIITEKSHKEGNALLQGRGLPGTHDIDLALRIFNQLIDGESNISIPRYDKGAFNGQGDRFGVENWTQISKKVDLVIFEGWFNGFMALSYDQVRIKYLTSPDSDSMLKRHSMYNIEKVNSKLKSYHHIWSLFDEFIYLQTESTLNVYKWRLEQEHMMIRSRGKGMKDEEVRKFVDRYMPVYELYYGNLCNKGLIKGHSYKLEITEDRSVSRTELL